MLPIRRTYFTSRLPSLSLPLSDQISVGKFLQPTRRSCPRRNHILGGNFCRFAIRLKLYTAANNDERINRKLMQTRYKEASSNFDLIDVTINDSQKIRLPSTGQYLSESISKSLNKWKQNAHHEIRNLYKNSSVTDDFVVETVRGVNQSLIGWYLQTYGMQNTLALIEWFGVPFDSETQPTTPLRVENTAEAQKKLNQLLDGYDILEKKLHYKFNDKAYLLQSVTHESFDANYLTPNYHGLDFVGDAILNYSIVRHLFRQPQYLDADRLQNVSSLLQSNSCLATVSLRHGIHKFIRYTTPTVRDNINSFTAFLRQNRFKPVNDLYFLDRKNYVFEVPPIIPSSFEALMGAIYFDSKMDLNVTSNTLLILMDWDIKNICKTNPQTAYVELNKLDSSAVFSDPVTVAPGKIQVSVTLPTFQNKRFNGFSRDAQLAKWAAAKAAVIQLKKQNNVFIPIKHKDAFKEAKQQISFNEIEL
ncbi:endoribonuclease Dcr-1-like [Contarinia nasturtii]|uniref:endoribonuclease Dcr-1-like n=1 Tax=Contarinia nasturtii TaxID=265458 RepID=UPI0012D40561|nr:endoribonuclease Dcr-1-like [Contarinia nasturtii]